MGNISSRDRLAIEKEKLEIEKLATELAILKRPWYRSPTYLSILLPALLTLTSLAYAISTGFFDKKFEVYKLEKATLELDIKKFEQEKNILIREKDTALIDRQQLKIQVENYKIQIATLNKKFNSHQDADVKLRYDSYGNIIEIASLNKTIKYNYNPNNQLISVTDGLGGVTNYSYDNWGRVIKITNPLGKITNFLYDTLGSRFSILDNNVFNPYPNPFHDILSFNLAKFNVKNISINIASVITGRVVYSKQYINQSGLLRLNLSGLNSGVYVIKLTADGSEKNFKVMKL